MMHCLNFVMFYLKIVMEWTFLSRPLLMRLELSCFGFTFLCLNGKD